MNEILLNVLSAIVTLVVIPLIGLLGTKLYQLIDNKIKNEKGSTIAKKASDIVLNAVKSVFQTYVESLKKSGSFNQESQLIAFEKAKEIITRQLTPELKNFISSNYGDINEWISTQIESSINTLKNN